MSGTDFYQSGVHAVWVNTTKKPFDGPRVRRALHLLLVSWEKINDGWYNYVRGHNPYNYFGMFDVVRFDTVWFDT